ncbi:MAG TPA: TonB-dependent receptor [Azospirillaceae bacterium]|nr:TonB-dependent receptor [Azospirillaceae bacterium]
MAVKVSFKSMLLGSAVGLGMAITAVPASAQIEEIVVTARKVEESLQQAPVAVTAFTGEALAERGITDVNDIARFTPGLSFSQAFGRTTDRPVIRGQANVLAGVQFGVESGTAYFIDGIYYPGDIQSLDLSQLERVEIIKGPQSALYGRNTYAGAINFITRTPGNEARAGAKLTVAEYDELELTGNVSGPIIADKLFASLNARHFEYGGQYRNRLTGKKVGDEQSDSVAGTLFLQASDNLTVRARGQISKDDDGPLALFLQPATANNCKPGFRSAAFRAGGTIVSTNNNQYYCGVIKPRPDLIALNTDPLPNGTADGTAYDGVEVQQYLASLAADYDIGGSGYTLTSQSGYRWAKRFYGTDSDHSDAFVFFGPPVVGGVPQEPAFANSSRYLIRDYSTELRLASPQDDRFRWLGGGYFFHNREENVDITFASGKGGLPFENAAGQEVTSPGSVLTEIENKALFALVAFDITEQLTATGEVRWAVEEKSRIDCCAPGRPGVQGFAGSEKYQSVTPRFTLDYQFTEDALLYGVFAKGNKPGGVNGSAGNTVGKPFYLQEESDNYEIGAKTTWLGGRLQVNASGYYIDATDVQLTQALASPTGQGALTSIATNQGAAEIKGFELEVQAAPTDQLTLGFGYSLTDAKFTKGCDDFEYVLNSGGFLIPAGYQGDLCDISGNRLPLGSKHKVSANATYEDTLVGETRFFLSGDLTYESSKYVQVHNLAETGDSYLLGARAGVRSDMWELAVFGRNLLDEDSIPLATRWFDLRHGFVPRLPPGTVGADTGTPRAFFSALRKGRTFGLSASVKY